MKSQHIALVLIFAFMCALLSHAQTSKTQTLSPDLFTAADPGVTAPKLVTAPDPKYSKEARKKKIEGTVVLRVTVGADGLPRDIKVRRSLGYGLDEEAIKAVKQWKFKPGELKGQPVAVKVNIEVNFRLS